METKYFDVLLADDEQPADLVRLLHDRFGVAVQVSDDQYNGALTIKVQGSPDQLRRVKHWHNAPRGPRPDLQGKPPVAKGEKRTSRCEALAVKGTGHGICDRPLDQHGQCDRAGYHYSEPL